MAKLILVPTPVGNMEDITLRALRILQECDIILAEDTRKSKTLLLHYNITTPLLSYHQYNEHQQLNKFIQLILDYNQVALITDAGTPGISDPGFLLVRACIQNHIEVETLPGATAFVPALVNSGLPCDRFYFYGFLPHKKGRKSTIEQLCELSETFVLYESPFRLVKTLEQFSLVIPDRMLCVCRELTKIHEENFRGTFTQALQHFQSKEVKGEIVIIVQGKNQYNKTKEEE
ncbi:MAG: 16S rRNA (cytidine(1402)-2'-O)-methyltransferase [Bacteroidales bacterium]|nr:16S rRNA (cytidine(1402)-2'-O)-methyltransferase [Bacteroidales bacterium]